MQRFDFINRKLILFLSIFVSVEAHPLTNIPKIIIKNNFFIEKLYFFISLCARLVQVYTN